MAVQYIKRETSHYINTLLDRTGFPLWEKYFDDPMLADASKALDAISYIYSNPSNDGLVGKIEDYEGLNSWKMFTSGSINLRQNE